MIMQLNMLRLKQRVPPEDLRRSVDEILEAANRAAELTKQLLLVSRRQPMQRSRIDANALVRDLTALLERLLGEHVTLAVEVGEEPLWFEGDAGMIEQVMTNLCLNARDAMPRGGRLTVSTSTEVVDGEMARRHDGARAGDFVCLRVSDTGVGMEPAVVERIFEAFFTTKAPGQGTGLGLAMVHAIVSKHGGWVEVDSRLGEGSTFRVFLPLAATPMVTSEKPATATVAGGRERILLVEDEVRVRSAAVFCLDHLGYQVTQAADGLEALKIWERDGGAFDLLLTDVVMPGGLSGLDLCARLRQTRAYLKTVIMSGYSVDLGDGDPVAGQAVTFLPKPFSLDMLAAAIRECLDGKSS
jgi:CheY-like chemotaxis protein